MEDADKKKQCAGSSLFASEVCQQAKELQAKIKLDSEVFPCTPRQTISPKPIFIDLVSDDSSDDNSPGPSRKIRKTGTHNNEGYPGPSRRKTKSERDSNKGFWSSSTNMGENEKVNNDEHTPTSSRCLAAIKKIQDEQDVKVWEDCLHIALEKLGGKHICSKCKVEKVDKEIQERLVDINQPD